VIMQAACRIGSAKKSLYLQPVKELSTIDNIFIDYRQWYVDIR
jgi:hypothetical protein